MPNDSKLCRRNFPPPSKGSGRIGREVFKDRNPAVLAPSRASRDWGPRGTGERQKPSVGPRVPGRTCHVMKLANLECCRHSIHKLKRARQGQRGLMLTLSVQAEILSLLLALRRWSNFHLSLGSPEDSGAFWLGRKHNKHQTRTKIIGATQHLLARM